MTDQGASTTRSPLGECQVRALLDVEQLKRYAETAGLSDDLALQQMANHALEHAVLMSARRGEVHLHAFWRVVWVTLKLVDNPWDDQQRILVEGTVLGARKTSPAASDI